MKNGKTILIVDDEKDLVSLLEVRFKKEGFECITAHNGKEALCLATEQKPDVILLDLVMPLMDGYETCKALKADEKTSKIPIVVYTAQPPEVVIKKGEGIFDVVDVILKPYDAGTLIRAVKDRVQKNPPKEHTKQY